MRGTRQLAGYTGEKYGCSFTNGYALVSTQYTFWLLMQMGCEDVTPEELRGVRKNVKKVMFVLYGGIGDFLMCLPALQSYRELHPDCEFTLGTLNEKAAVIAGHPLITEKLVCSPHHVGLRVSDFDDALDFSGVIVRRHQLSDVMNGYDLACEHLGVPRPKNMVPDVAIEEFEEIRLASKLQKEHGIGPEDDIILLAPQSSTPLRTWRYDWNRELGVRLAEHYPKKRVVVVGDTNDIESLSWYACSGCGRENTLRISGIKDKHMEYACGECQKKQRMPVLSHPRMHFIYNFDIRQMMALVDRSSYVIGVDSGVLHVAGALEKPILGLFSAFEADLRLRYFPKARWIQKEYPCAPCFLHHVECVNAMRQKTDWLIKRPLCMEELSVDEVFEATRKLIDEEPWENVVLPHEDPNPRPCPLCLEEEREFIMKKGGFFYFKCKVCESVYTGQPLGSSSAEAMYNSEVFRYNAVFEKPGMVQMNQYLAHEITRIYGPRYKFKGRLLEIGCNVGTLLLEASRLGWKCTGIEIQKEAAEKAQENAPEGVNIISGNFETMNWAPEDAFDVIVLHHVYEHFTDFYDTTKRLASMLSKNGLLLVYVPDAKMSYHTPGENKHGHFSTTFGGEHGLVPSLLGMKIVMESSGLSVVGHEPQSSQSAMAYIMQRSDVDRTHIKVSPQSKSGIAGVYRP
jgi:ADP-heptose:LPS heptosyltransferase